ncbi:hypothetical protein [Clostridioides difficile]|uniref:hypothetical protein n=1 Tax=Clostridioides difficile TaxID=1496 RepID=UPI001EDB2D9E|nr:hypothetical protein [Clostridioides difficile]
MLSVKTDPMICIRRNNEKVDIKQNSFINKFMIKLFKDYGNIASKIYKEIRNVQIYL